MKQWSEPEARARKEKDFIGNDRRPATLLLRPNIFISYQPFKQAPYFLYDPSFLFSSSKETPQE